MSAQFNPDIFPLKHNPIEQRIVMHESGRTVQLLIAGAGIAGLSAAIALAQRGHQVILLERAAELGEVGAGLQLQPNATRVLEKLGIGEALKRCAVLHQGATLRMAKTGKLISRIPPSANHSEFPHYQIHRADLHEILVTRAKQLGVSIELDARVSNYVQLANRVEVQTIYGNSYAGNALIGADGVNSAVRSIMLGVDNPVFTGHVCYRGLVPANQLGESITACGIAGPGRHFVMYPVRRNPLDQQGQLINFVAQVESSEWREESWYSPADPAELRALFKGWDPTVTKLLEQVQQTFKWALYTRAPLPAWSERNVVLVGDACHPTLPNLASGAGMAIEDGYILAELVSLHPQNLALAFERFYQIRFDRCRKIQLHSARMARFFHIKNPLERWLKYNAARLLTRIAPKTASRRMTWTHEYNALEAVKGPEAAS